MASKSNRGQSAAQRILKLCGEAYPPHGQYFCTRHAGHHGQHIASVGPYAPGVSVIVEWPAVEQKTAGA